MIFKEDSIIYEEYRGFNGLGIIDKINRIINQGYDVYITNTEDEHPLLVYNTGSKNNPPEESIISISAYETFHDYKLETGADIDLNAGEFFDPASWVKISSPRDLQQFKNNNDSILVTCHNGSPVEVL